jgi:hypothetical protein
MSSHLAGLDAVLIVTCGRCRDHREVRLDALPDGYGALRLAEVVRRLRCSICHEAPAGVALRTRLREMALIGLGAHD